MGSSHPTKPKWGCFLTDPALCSLTGCDCQAPLQRCRHEDDHLCGSHRVMTPSALQGPEETCPSHRRGKVVWGGF